jgi:Xaa-Pro aminopeptidase
VGQDPSAGQRRLFDLCLAAMTAGEKVLKAGQACLSVYQAVRGVFEMGGMAQFFPHHAGHGLGLMHPENPFLVRHADETLWEGDVVTLEPGLYVPGVGGLRIEHNYLVKAGGFERLSNHAIDLK